MEYDFIVIEAGSAGCGGANRLSADRRTSVLLVEAGKDMPPNTEPEPEDILDIYAGNAYVNSAYRWNNIRAVLSSSKPEKVIRAGASPGRLLVDQRTSRWSRGAGGRRSVGEQRRARMGMVRRRSYFKRLERDLNYEDDDHGHDGPVPIRRIFPDHWDPFSQAAAAALGDAGFAYVADLNYRVREGLESLLISNAYGRRVSVGMVHLGNAVRARPNFDLLTNTVVQKLVFEGRRVAGVEVKVQVEIPEPFPRGTSSYPPARSIRRRSFCIPGLGQATSCGTCPSP